MRIKRHLNFVNASYLFTPISYLDKTYTTTAQEPSIYSSQWFDKLTLHLIYYFSVAFSKLEEVIEIKFITTWRHIGQFVIMLNCHICINFFAVILKTIFTFTCCVFWPANRMWSTHLLVKIHNKWTHPPATYFASLCVTKDWTVSCLSIVIKVATCVAVPYPFTFQSPFT